MPPKRAKGKAMTLGAFQGVTVGEEQEPDWAKNANWADEPWDPSDVGTAHAPIQSRVGGAAVGEGGDWRGTMGSLDWVSRLVPDEVKAPFVAFVGNLVTDISEEEVTEFFEECGPNEVRVIRKDGKRTFAYVEFEEREHLAKALMLSGKHLQKRQVKIDIAEGRSKESVKAQKDRQHSQADGHWRDNSGAAQPEFGARSPVIRGGGEFMGRDAMGAEQPAFGGFKDGGRGGGFGSGGGMFSRDDFSSEQAPEGRSPNQSGAPQFSRDIFGGQSQPQPQQELKSPNKRRSEGFGKAPSQEFGREMFGESKAEAEGGEEEKKVWRRGGDDRPKPQPKADGWRRNDSPKSPNAKRSPAPEGGSWRGGDDKKDQRQVPPRSEGGPQRVVASDGPQRVVASDGPQRVVASDGPQRVVATEGPQRVVASEPKPKPSAKPSAWGKGLQPKK